MRVVIGMHQKFLMEPQNKICLKNNVENYAISGLKIGLFLKYYVLPGHFYLHL